MEIGFAKTARRQLNVSRCDPYHLCDEVARYEPKMRYRGPERGHLSTGVSFYCPRMLTFNHPINSVFFHLLSLWLMVKNESNISILDSIQKQ